MKHFIPLLLCLFLVSCDKKPVQIEDKPSTSVSKASLQSWSLPINEKTDKTLKLLTTHYKCSLTVFFEMNGIAFPEGAMCSLNSKKKVVDVFHTHQNATLISIILGDIMLTLLKTEMTPEKYLKTFITQGDNNVSCFPSPKKATVSHTVIEIIHVEESEPQLLKRESKGEMTKEEMNKAFDDIIAEKE